MTQSIVGRALAREPSPGPVSPGVAIATAERALAARLEVQRATDDVLAMVADSIPCPVNRGHVHPVTPGATCSNDGGLTMSPGANPWCPACGWTLATPVRS